ncbi:MAG: THUMP domain-containing protein [Candidatus Verstraetearchaeota archaeon]|nr:THUMP domain-containing protein [Candidatus Verstraetearchaeota archaeon]
MKNVVIVRLGGEIGIKSRPVRRMYELEVLNQIQRRLRAHEIPFSKVWRTAGRIYILTEESDRALELAARTFGVSSASSGLLTTSDMDDMVEMSLRLSEGFEGTFAVKCRRVGKHPYTSQEVAAKIGDEILKAHPSLRVDLENPDHVVNLEIRDETAVFYAKSLMGPDGFPVGSQDTAVGMLDESLDSLLASWCIMKRGSPLIAVVPRPQESSRVTRNLTLLSKWAPGCSIKAVILPLTAREANPIFHLFLASAYAKSKGIPAIISGLPVATLKVLSELQSKLPVPALFPLISVDGALLRKWVELMGLDLRNELRYDVAIDHTDLPGNIDIALRDSIEVMVMEDGSFSRP